MTDFKKRILVTGGAGFIGSNFLNRLVPKHPDYLFVCLDALTYAGNIRNLEAVSQCPNYQFIHGDITDYAMLDQIFQKYQISHVVHFAAESHVDRSIVAPLDFVKTNVLGTMVLLHCAKAHWLDAPTPPAEKLFLHVSTDEVYGSLAPGAPAFSEKNRYEPHSPYSASKASSDHFARAYGDTYGLPVAVSNCSNNYGPYQFPEKLIPLVINNIVEQRSIPVYGDGQQIRDWLYVADHVDALFCILENAAAGETYNIGGLNEKTNLEIVELLVQLTDKVLGQAEGQSRKLIRFVKDRPGHDRRYAIDARKIEKELGWKPAYTFEEGIRETVNWYLNHREWMQEIVSGEYMKYYKDMYGDR